MANPIRLEGLDSVKELIAGLGPGLQRANERAQNTMAYELMMAEKAEMRSDIDRPTPFSLASVGYKKYGVQNLNFPGVEGAAVYLMNRISNVIQTEEHYLGVQIAGGKPTLKAMESIFIRKGYMKESQYIVPASTTYLDAYGNLKGSQITAMLTNLGVGFVPPVQKPKWRFAKDANSRVIGVFIKEGDVWSPYIWFVDRPNYRPRYKWDERAKEEISQNFKEILGDAIDYEIQKMAK